MKPSLTLFGLFAFFLSISPTYAAGTCGDLYSQDYQSFDALAKQEIIWQNIVSSKYASLPPLTFLAQKENKFVQIWKVAKAAFSLGLSFDHVGDEMPAGRIKAIHRYGSVAKVQFTSSGDHPFTGLFNDQSHGLVRLSLALPRPGQENFVPGMAIKLLVDGNPSKNMHVMQKLEGQGKNTNYFLHTFTNSLPMPVTGSTKAGKWFFERFVGNAIRLTVDHVAAVSAEGQAVASAKAPFQVFFEPAEGLVMDSQAKDYREELAKVPVGTVLYNVYALETQNSEKVLIGTLSTNSEFVASEYGDKTLYFQHEGSFRRTFWTGQKIENQK